MLYSNFSQWSAPVCFKIKRNHSLIYCRLIFHQSLVTQIFQLYQKWDRLINKIYILPSSLQNWMLLYIFCFRKEFFSWMNLLHRVSRLPRPHHITSVVYVLQHRYTLTGCSRAHEHTTSHHHPPRESTWETREIKAKKNSLKWKADATGLFLYFHPWRSSLLNPPCCVGRGITHL